MSGRILAAPPRRAPTGADDVAADVRVLLAYVEVAEEHIDAALRAEDATTRFGQTEIAILTIESAMRWIERHMDRRSVVPSITARIVFVLRSAIAHRSAVIASAEEHQGNA